MLAGHTATHSMRHADWYLAEVRVDRGVGRGVPACKVQPRHPQLAAGKDGVGTCAAVVCYCTVTSYDEGRPCLVIAAVRPRNSCTWYLVS